MLYEILAVYLIALVYFLLWLSIREKESKILHFSILITTLLILFIFGIYQHRLGSYSEISKIGSGILFSGPLILFGPCLFYLTSKNNKVKLGALSLLILPIAGAIFMFISLLLTGQIWGM